MSRKTKRNLPAKPLPGTTSTATTTSREPFGLTDAKRRAIRRWMFGGMGALMVGGIAVGFVPFFLASYQLSRFCESLPIGSPTADAQGLALARGYELSIQPDGEVRITVPRMTSQFVAQRGCMLRPGERGLQSATFGVLP